MKVLYFIKRDNGNVKAITDIGMYEIAKDADHGISYGICLPTEDIFISIEKGVGRKAFNIIIGQINTNKNIPVFNEHYFTPQLNDTNFCDKCQQYLTHEAHKRGIK